MSKYLTSNSSTTTSTSRSPPQMTTFRFVHFIVSNSVPSICERTFWWWVERIWLVLCTDIGRCINLHFHEQFLFVFYFPWHYTRATHLHIIPVHWILVHSASSHALIVLPIRTLSVFYSFALSLKHTHTYTDTVVCWLIICFWTSNGWHKLLMRSLAHSFQFTDRVNWTRTPNT